MPTYEPADEQVLDLAKEILTKYESHAPLIKHKVKFDFVFAHPTVDENGEAHGEAIKKNGVKALGLCRVINLKHRIIRQLLRLNARVAVFKAAAADLKRKGTAVSIFLTENKNDVPTP